MGDNSLHPPHFSGKSTDNAYLWLSTVRCWLDYKGLQRNDQASVSAIGLLLKDGARLWFDTLTEHKKQNSKTLLEAFEKRYMNKGGSRWKEMADLYNVKPKQAETR